jgi:hypothetical protein
MPLAAATTTGAQRSLPQPTLVFRVFFGSVSSNGQTAGFSFLPRKNLEENIEVASAMSQKKF